MISLAGIIISNTIVLIDQIDLERAAFQSRKPSYLFPINV
jgi:multidrug efflux pump subunit AcrB